MNMEIDESPEKGASKSKNPEPEQKQLESGESKRKIQPKETESAVLPDTWILSRIINDVKKGDFNDSQLQILVVALANYAGVAPKHIKCPFIKYCCEQYRKEPLYGMKGSLSKAYRDVIDKSQGILFLFFFSNRRNGIMIHK